MSWILLIAGLALWYGAHFWKRLAPASRARMGDPGKGLVAVLVVLSIVLMVLGYRGAFGPVWWGRSGALVGINNLLMILAFYIYASGATPPGRPRNTVGTKLRHPQLVGFSIWAAAHLIPNGDLASYMLFGGLLIWALMEMALINRSEPAWQPPAWGGRASEIKIAVIGLVALIVTMLIHYWLGVTPWG
ncbi:NnrU family protein [Gymnodinialimonas sp.]